MRHFKSNLAVGASLAIVAFTGAHVALADTAGPAPEAPATTTQWRVTLAKWAPRLWPDLRVTDIGVSCNRARRACGISAILHYDDNSTFEQAVVEVTRIEVTSPRYDYGKNPATGRLRAPLYKGGDRTLRGSYDVVG